jgi:hypothetical protein
MWAVQAWKVQRWNVQANANLANLANLANVANVANVANADFGTSVFKRIQSVAAGAAKKTVPFGPGAKQPTNGLRRAPMPNSQPSDSTGTAKAKFGPSNDSGFAKIDKTSFGRSIDPGFAPINKQDGRNVDPGFSKQQGFESPNPNAEQKGRIASGETSTNGSGSNRCRANYFCTSAGAEGRKASNSGLALSAEYTPSALACTWPARSTTSTHTTLPSPDKPMSLRSATGSV